jgi:hypothetical protein
MSLSNEPTAISDAQRRAFSIAVGGIGRLFHLRDRLLGWVDSGSSAAGVHERASHHSIASGASQLDAVFVEPIVGPAVAGLLLCHGIGETVRQWFGVQQLLAAHGIASLVFDYSGYGKSTGNPDWEQLERDTIAAFATLVKIAPELPLSILGFSLGSGAAAATVNWLAASRLILCEAFTSFREAAACVGLPRSLAALVPPIWDARGPLANCVLPVLIVHGERDRLFPARLARDLAGYCPAGAEVVLVPDTAHNQPFRRPELAYWEPVISWLSQP